MIDFIQRHQAQLSAAALAGLLMLCSGTAWADGDITSDITGFAKNINTLLVVVYEGIVLVIGSLAMLSVGKELVPAIVDSKKREGAEFKQHIRNAVLAVVVTLAFALAPLWVPALFSFFGVGDSIDWSMSA